MISYVAIAWWVMVAVEVTDILAIPVASLVALAAACSARRGFGAQRIVQDLLSGFFIITEKQYGFGDLVELTLGTSNDGDGHGRGRHAAGDQTAYRGRRAVHHPNGQIFKTLNLSKDWARAVIDIPVPSTADLSVVNDVPHHVCEAARWTIPNCVNCCWTNRS